MPYSWHVDCFCNERGQMMARQLHQAMARSNQPPRGNVPPARGDTIRKEWRVMINFILWLLFGALVGWLASLVMRTDAQQGALLNIVVGIVGAMIGGFLLGGPTINSNT